MRNTLKAEKNWTDLKDVLLGAIKSIGIKSPDPINWLSFQWELVVGKELSVISQVHRFHSQTLYVLLKGLEWKPALEPLKPKIIREINDQAGKTILKKIVFNKGDDSKFKKAARFAPKKKNSEFYSPPTGEFRDDDDVQGIDDMELRKTLQRIGKKFRFSETLAILLLMVSGCATVDVTATSPEPQVIQEDLQTSESYAVKDIQNRNNQDPNANFVDPRAYYHYLRGLHAERSHDYATAIPYYYKVVALDPKNDQFSYKLARLLLRVERFDELIQVAEEGLRRFPDDAQLHMLLGDVLDSTGKSQSALEHYQKVINLHPHSSRSYLLSGIIYEKLEQYRKAEEMFHQMMTVDANNPLSYHYLGRINAHLGKYEESDKYFRKALALRPSFRKSRELLGWVLEKRGNFNEAIKEYKFLLKLEPNNKRVRELIARAHLLKDSFTPRFDQSLSTKNSLPKESNIHMKIGTFYYEQVRYIKALEEFRLVLADKEAPEIRLLIARIYEILERYDESINELEHILKTEPEHVDILLQIARLYNLNKKTKDSIRLIRRAIEIQPKNDELYHSLSVAYLSTNQLDKATESIRTAISLNDSVDSYYFQLGALLERQGKYEEAIQSIQKALEINPMNSNAHNFIGYIYAVQGRSLDEALEHLNKALIIQPKNGYFLDSLGWIYFKKGDSERALAEVRKAMVYTPPDPVLFNHLGDIHFELKNYLKASKAWKTGLSLTRKKMKESTSWGEVPDVKAMEGKIRKVEEILRQSY